MNHQLYLTMIKIGWNIKEINDLIKESKRMEKLFANQKRYDNAHKITDFKGIKKYYCFKHHCFHYKYRNTYRDGKKVKIKTDSFVLCKGNAYQLSDAEIFKKQFKSSLRNYSIESHKKSYGSKKQ